MEREDLRPYVTMNDGRPRERQKLDGTRGASVCVWCNHTTKRHGPDGCEGLTEYGGPACTCRRAKTGREAAGMLQHVPTRTAPKPG